jgi:predicted nucleotidyltransferase
LRQEYAILYGSRARGEDRPDSDADLALILAEGEADWDLATRCGLRSALRGASMGLSDPEGASVNRARSYRP